MSEEQVERGLRRQIERTLAEFFDETRGACRYEMYRAHLEHTANTIMDAFAAAALGDVEHEEHEKHPPPCKHQWSPWRFRSRGGWVRECALCHQGELTFDAVVANATKGGDA